MNQSKPPALPVILEPASLPREQVGPFLILGVDKVADREEVEAAWAKRLIWSRKNLMRTPLEDINWAREALGDADRRIRADAGSLNLDTSDGMLRRLAQRYGKIGAETGGRPVDIEPPLADYSPPIVVPDPEEVRKEIVVAEAPREFPAVTRILEDFMRQPIDPWDPDLLGGEEHGEGTRK